MKQHFQFTVAELQLLCGNICNNRRNLPVILFLFHGWPVDGTAHYLRNVIPEFMNRWRMGNQCDKMLNFLIRSIWWHGNAFHITGLQCGESTGDWWILLIKGQKCRALMFSLVFMWTSCWMNTCQCNDDLHWECLAFRFISQFTAITVQWVETKVTSLSTKIVFAGKNR